MFGLVFEVLVTHYSHIFYHKLTLPFSLGKQMLLFIKNFYYENKEPLWGEKNPYISSSCVPLPQPPTTATRAGVTVQAAKMTLLASVTFLKFLAFGTV